MSDPAAPFSYFPADPGDPRGVLLLHGFSGTPFEMHLLGQDLQHRGYRCAAPLLPGHGVDVATLARSTWHDWLAGAETALHALQAQATRIAVVGLSMGSLLAVELCRRHPIRAAVLLASALRLSRVAMRAVPLLSASRLRGLSLPKLLGPDVRDREQGRRNPALRAMPIAAVGSLVEFMNEVRPHLHEVRQPALCVHGAHDHTIPYACLGELLTALGTPREQLTSLTLRRSRHLLPIDVERAQLFSAVDAHLSRYL